MLVISIFTRYFKQYLLMTSCSSSIWTKSSNGNYYWLCYHRHQCMLHMRTLQHCIAPIRHVQGHIHNRCSLYVHYNEQRKYQKLFQQFQPDTTSPLRFEGLQGLHHNRKDRIFLEFVKKFNSEVMKEFQTVNFNFLCR